MAAKCYYKIMNIGVFDSGIGGEAVAAELKKAFPEAEITVANDKNHIPYGSRPPEEVVQLTEAAIQPLLTSSDVVVLACNTATAAAIETLREKYPHVPFVGLEPMIKPAALQTKTGVIAVCATPATLQSERYQNLKLRYAQRVTVLEPDCSNWAYMIENKKIDEDAIKATVETACDQNADVIALACTHYHWIKQRIETYAANRAEIIEPSSALAAQIERVVKNTSL